MSAFPNVRQTGCVDRIRFDKIWIEMRSKTTNTINHDNGHIRNNTSSNGTRNGNNNSNNKLLLVKIQSDVDQKMTLFRECKMSCATFQPQYIVPVCFRTFSRSRSSAYERMLTRSYRGLLSKSLNGVGNNFTLPNSYNDSHGRNPDGSCVHRGSILSRPHKQYPCKENTANQ